MSSSQGTFAEQARILHQQAPASQLGGIAVAVVLTGILWGEVPTGLLLGWLGVFSIITFARFLCWTRFRSRTFDAETALIWYRTMLVLFAISGVTWAFASWQFFSVESPLMMGLLIAIFAALIAGGIGSLAPVAACYVAYVLPIGVALTARMGIEPTIPVLIPIGFSIFCLVCMLYTRNMEATIIEMIKLRLENEALVSDLEQVAREAQETSESKSRFLAVASHDLMQPLNALGLLARALHHERDEARIRKLIESTSQSVSQLSSMFDSIMDLSKLEAQAVEPDFQTQSITEILKPVVAECDIAAREKGIEFRSSMDHAQVRTDPALLQRVVMNLLSNAVKFTDSGSVEIESMATAHGVRLRISDTGRGIREADQPVVFKEYYQAERGAEGGMGLGLAIVARLSDLLDIEIGLDSAPGRGTTFLLAIPGPADSVLSRSA